MWKRLAVVAELLHLDRQRQRESDNVESTSTMEETKSFLLRVANRIFTSRELSQPEVLGHLLGFGTDFTNVEAWTWTHLDSLYWACARQWSALNIALSTIGREVYSDNVYFKADGFKLSYLEAYKYRGPSLQALCFYDYVSLVVLRKEHRQARSTVSISFLPTADVCKGWIQCLRPAGKTAVPVLDGRLTDELDEPDGNYVKR